MRFSSAIAILAAILSAPSKADESGPLAGWTSASHLGFGVVDRSTTGFAKTAGSLVYLDALRPIGSKSLTFGLRTLAQGGKSSAGEYYRLGAGPVIAYQVFPNWWLQTGVQGFRETAYDSADSIGYRSRGLVMLLGWDRRVPLGTRADFTWGGFLSRHRGNAGNEGLTRAVALGLAIRL